MRMFLTVILTVIVFVVVISLLSPAPKNYFGDYNRYIEGETGQVELSERVLLFENAFSDLTDKKMTDKINDLYADNLYFNDTLKTVQSKAELLTYFNAMHEMVSAGKMTVVNESESNGYVYVEWKMDFTAKIAWKQVKSETYGVSKLRFNDDGKIIMHQDFWDSTVGFYQQLPIFALLYSLIK